MALSGEATMAAQLRGVVRDEAGKPVAGATVYVAEVRPAKKALGYESNFYPEWGKRVLSGADGAFVVEEVGEGLEFDLIVAAAEHPALSVKDVRPGKKVTAKLAKWAENVTDQEHQWRGVVKDPEGKPAWGVEVSPQSYQLGFGYAFGAPPGMQERTVTNEKGEFVLSIEKPETGVSLRFTGRENAPLVTGFETRPAETAEYQLSSGSTVKGKLVHEGKPVAGAIVMASQEDRNSATFVGTRIVKADEQGEFEIQHLRTAENYMVIAISQTLPEGTFTPTQKFKTTEEALELTDLEAVAGHTLAGKVVLSDGKKVPKGVKVTVHRENASDHRTADIAEDGSFKMIGMPNETVMVWVMMGGDYHLSVKNESLERSNGMFLLGVVEEETVDLNILMEPGPGERQQVDDWTKLRHEKLRGAPAE
jgi:hypothetical protein